MENKATITRNDFRPQSDFLAELAAWTASLERNSTYRPTPAVKPEPTIDNNTHDFFACLMGGTRKMK